MLHDWLVTRFISTNCVLITEGHIAADAQEVRGNCSGGSGGLIRLKAKKVSIFAMSTYTCITSSVVVRALSQPCFPELPRGVLSLRQQRQALFAGAVSLGTILRT